MNGCRTDNVKGSRNEREEDTKVVSDGNTVKTVREEIIVKMVKEEISVEEVVAEAAEVVEDTNSAKKLKSESVSLFSFEEHNFCMMLSKKFSFIKKQSKRTFECPVHKERIGFIEDFCFDDQLSLRDSSVWNRQ